MLAETGCYADFTFPSVPSPTQPRTVNAIYYAKDRPGNPRGHDTGIEARVRGREDHGTTGLRDHGAIRARGGRPPRHEQQEAVHSRQTADTPAPETRDSELRTASPPCLLLVQGPLALNWRWRKWGILPRIEHADLSGSNPPTPLRADLWVRQHIHVRGKPEWIFVKLHTHGCLERNAAALLGKPMQDMHHHLQSRYNDGDSFHLHYVTSREMINIIHAAEAGMDGNPGDYRDYRFAPPPVR